MVDRPADGARKTGHYNVVMIDLAEVATAENHLRDLGAPPSILPVLHQPTRGTSESAEKQCGCLVESPGKRGDVLAEIDGLMERRLKDNGGKPQPKRR